MSTYVWLYNEYPILERLAYKITHYSVQTHPFIAAYVGHWSGFTLIYLTLGFILRFAWFLNPPYKNVAFCLVCSSIP